MLSLLALMCVTQVRDQAFELEPDPVTIAPLRVVSFRNEREGLLIDARGAVFRTVRVRGVGPGR